MTFKKLVGTGIACRVTDDGRFECTPFRICDEVRLDDVQANRPGAGRSGRPIYRTTGRGSARVRGPRPLTQAPRYSASRARVALFGDIHTRCGPRRLPPAAPQVEHGCTGGGQLGSD